MPNDTDRAARARERAELTLTYYAEKFSDVQHYEGAVRELVADLWHLVASDPSKYAEFGDHDDADSAIDDIYTRSYETYADESEEN